MCVGTPDDAAAAGGKKNASRGASNVRGAWSFIADKPIDNGTQ